MNDVLSVMDKSVLEVKFCLNCKVLLSKIVSLQNKLMTTVFKSDESG
jgi:hypothetical protein